MLEWIKHKVIERDHLVFPIIIDLWNIFIELTTIDSSKQLVCTETTCSDTDSMNGSSSSNWFWFRSNCHATMIPAPNSTLISGDPLAKVDNSLPPLERRRRRRRKVCVSNRFEIVRFTNNRGCLERFDIKQSLIYTDNLTLWSCKILL